MGAAGSAGAIASASTGMAAAALSVAVAACCVSPVIAPIIVGALGAGGAVWAAGLKPYGGWILGASLLCLGLGFWSTYRSRPACDVEDMPTRSRVLQTVAKVSLWVGAVSWTAALVVRLTLS